MALDKKRVVVALSGGVDSSVAAALLSRDFEVVALHFTKFTLRGLADEVRRRDEKSLAAAREAAAHLGLEIEAVEAGERFADLVDFFCAEYDAARTPNPCVRCNATIKWPLLMQAADRLGAYSVATGHYAAIERRGALVHLVRPSDHRKDQTYFLNRLTQAQLARTIFPLSGLRKDQVRRRAHEMGLKSVERAESQEICFVPASYRSLLDEHAPQALRPGPILDMRGKEIGTHEGYQLYTIGQRKGLGVALGRPAYVVSIDQETGAVVLGDKHDLAADGLVARGLNWVAGSAPADEFRALVKIRYNHPGAEAILKVDGDTAKVRFDEPVNAITPGQAAVFYRSDEVLGAGWITRAARGGCGEFA